MLRVALVFAQLEREQTSERVKDVMAYRAENGLHNGGKPAYGYDLVNKGLVLHKQERKIIELIFNKFIETRSTLETAKALNTLGYRNRMDKLWDCRKILQIIKNPLYIGKVNWADKQYPGLHQPLIPEKIFEQVQIVFQKKGHNFFAYTNTNALLRGLLICGYCHNMMTPSHSLNSQKKKFFYYRCTSTINHVQKKETPCKIKYVAFKTIEPKITSLLLSLTRESQFKLIENKILKHNQQIEKNTQGIRAEITALQNKLEGIKLNKDRYLDSLISSQFLSSERKKITEKLEDLDLEEKQTKAALFKQELTLNQKSYDQIALTEFKEALIALRCDYEAISKTQLQQYLNKTLKGIVYFSDRLTLQFHLLPWPLEFATENPPETTKEKPAKQPISP
jgi:site-specific DNA recombinase